MTSIFRHVSPLPVGVDSGHVMTVLGPLPVEKMGVTLVHEHILLDASGKWVPPSCCGDRDIGEQKVHIGILGALRMNPLMNRDNCQLFDVETAIEELMRFRELGGETVVDPTNLGIGRDPAALQVIARRTGLNIVMSTGFYLEPTHPRYVSERSIDDLAEQLIFEVGGSDEKPAVVAGLIGEIGVSAAFTANEEKSLRAAARASAATRVPLSVHLPGWVRHGHREYDMIGMDYFYADEAAQSPSDEENARAIKALIDAGFIDRVLMSQDVFLKTMLTRYGGFGYGYILKHFVPRLRRHGVTDAQIETMMIANPARVFALQR
jgi:phosphotriesterase-related protein